MSVTYGGNMGTYFYYFSLIIIGLVLLWFGFTIFFSSYSPFYRGFFPWRRKLNMIGVPGDPQVCPVCSIQMGRGELVKSVAFPSVTGGMDRLMYIRGCFNCLENNISRSCPVCGSDLSIRDFLVSRMFERVGTKNHVHVLGCNQCRRT